MVSVMLMKIYIIKIALHVRLENNELDDAAPTKIVYTWSTILAVIPYHMTYTDISIQILNGNTTLFVFVILLF